MGDNTAHIRIDKTLDLIKAWGGIDGDHHKQWLLDQIVRTLCLDDDEYEAWVNDYNADSEDAGGYPEWETGVAP